MRTRKLADIDDDTLIRALTDPDLQDFDTAPKSMRDLSRVSDADLTQALCEPDLMDLR